MRGGACCVAFLTAPAAWTAVLSRAWQSHPLPCSSSRSSWPCPTPPSLQLADPGIGRINMQYRRVECAPPEPMQVGAGGPQDMLQFGRVQQIGSPARLQKLPALATSSPVRPFCAGGSHGLQGPRWLAAPVHHRHRRPRRRHLSGRQGRQQRLEGDDQLLGGHLGAAQRAQRAALLQGECRAMAVGLASPRTEGGASRARAAAGVRWLAALLQAYCRMHRLPAQLEHCYSTLFSSPPRSPPPPHLPSLLNRRSPATVGRWLRPTTSSPRPAASPLAPAPQAPAPPSPPECSSPSPIPRTAR